MSLYADDPQFPGNTVLSFDPDSLDIINYIQRNTAEALPLVAKIMYLYVKGLLTDPSEGVVPEAGSVPAALDTIDSFTDPYRRYMTSYLLAPSVAGKFGSVDVQYVINYSRIRKDHKLFEMVTYAYFNPDDVTLVYSDHFGLLGIESLDDMLQADAKVDQGFRTDMTEHGIPRYVAVIRYPYIQGSGYDMENFLLRVGLMADLAYVVIPARIFFGIYLCPELFHDLIPGNNITDVLDPVHEMY